MKTLVLMLLVGFVQTVCYFGLLQSERPEGGVAITQADTPCYVQAAARIVEGHPFSYARGLPPTTGTTSVLYPFVLAVPMALGADGMAAFTASFFANAAFYLVFLFGWGLVIVRLFRPGPGRLAAALLVALSGHSAEVAFGQCDIGLFMALTGFLAYAFVARRTVLAAALLVLAPWVRPEGMMIVFACGILSVLRRNRREFALAAFGGLAALGVFALNYAISGEFQFSSVASKGFFRNLEFLEALGRTLSAGFDVCASYLCAIPTQPTRWFSTPSVFACLFFWVGVGALARRGRELLLSPLLPLYLGMAIAFAAIAQSGFAIICYDRYFGWMLPLVLLVAAKGVEWASARLAATPFRRLPLVLVAVGALFSTVASPLLLAESARRYDENFEAIRNSRRNLTGDPVVGDFFFFSTYALDGLRFRNLCGIYDPAFRESPLVGFLPDLLKHRPELRFDVWSIWLDPSWTNRVEESFMTATYGQLVPGGTPSCQLRLADWSAYDRAAETPLTADGFELVDWFDIGYREDERAHRFDGARRDSDCAQTAARSADGLAMVESGRCCNESESFECRVRPGCDARLVLRTTGRIFSIFDASPDGKPIITDYPNGLELTVLADGKECARVTAERSPGVFTDVEIPIPGAALAQETVRFAFRGEFAAFGYWVFQKGDGK